MNYSHPPRAHVVDCGPACAPLAAANVSHTSLPAPHAYSCIRGKAALPRRLTRRTCSRAAGRKPPTACPRRRRRSPSRVAVPVLPTTRHMLHRACHCASVRASVARERTRGRGCTRLRAKALDAAANRAAASLRLSRGLSSKRAHAAALRQRHHHSVRQHLVLHTVVYTRPEPSCDALQRPTGGCRADWHVTYGTLARGLTSAVKKTPAVKRPLCAASRMHGRVAAASWHSPQTPHWHSATAGERRRA